MALIYGVTIGIYSIGLQRKSKDIGMGVDWVCSHSAMTWIGLFVFYRNNKVGVDWVCHGCGLGVDLW